MKRYPEKRLFVGMGRLNRLGMHSACERACKGCTLFVLDGGLAPVRKFDFGRNFLWIFGESDCGCCGKRFSWRDEAFFYVEQVLVKSWTVAILWGKPLVLIFRAGYNLSDCQKIVPS